MTIEVPVLHLGLAGFAPAQRKAVDETLAAASGARVRWALAPFGDADAWWLEGSRTVILPNQHLRVQPAAASERPVQLALADVDRPVAFTLPVTAPGFRPGVSFSLQNKAAGVAVLDRFADWLQTMLGQFALAASIAENQPTLAAGSWEVLRGAELLAVVDLRLGVGVRPGVQPQDFVDASWCIRDHGDVVIPGKYPRASVSQVMWQYAQRTDKDLLPPHYREHPLFFRRPPRLAQRHMKDTHLLLMRELIAHPGMSFRGLQQSTGLAEAALARCLSALYVVGAITSNPKRAMAGSGRAARDRAVAGQAAPSMMDSAPRPTALQLADEGDDLTAPLPLMPEG